MRRPVTTFVRHNGIKCILAAEYGLKKAVGGKFTPNIFDVETEYVGTNVKIIKETSDSTYIAKFDTSGRISSCDFKIMFATDMHLCDDMKLINKALNMLSKHIRKEKPDLILFPGDVILTAHQQIDAVQFGQLMEKFGIYWAYVFGNHEARAEKEYHKYFLMKNLSSFPHCLSKMGDESLFGYGNFIINIMKSENEIQQSIFGFDSGRDIIDSYRKEYNIPDDMQGYDFLKNNQIEWYKNSVNTLEKSYGKFKSIMFFHIPLPEYQEVIKEENGKFVFTDNAKILYGGAFESIGCSSYNSGMFDAILELDNTQAVFVGHDHVNDFCAIYKGVYLVYAQCEGYDCYTMEEKTDCTENDWIQGVTMVKVHCDGSIDIQQRFNRDFL